MLRIRDEINMTLDAYKTIYESSTGFGCRKALMAANDEHETVKHVEHMDDEIFSLQKEVSELLGEQTLSVRSLTMTTHY